MRLKMNEEKTEFIYFGSKQQLSTTHCTTIVVNNVLVERSTCVRYLGGYLDSELKFKTHVTKKCQAAMLLIFKIRCIRKYLT